jgi:hypothetical protein
MTDADHSNFETPTDMTTDEISARDSKLNDDYTIKMNVPPSAHVINHADDTALSDDNDNQMLNQGQNPPTRSTFPTILKMVAGSVRGNIFSLKSDNEDDATDDVPQIPTMVEVLERAKRHYSIKLDAKQLKAYKMICATFMIKIIKDQISGSSSEHNHPEQATKMNCKEVKTSSLCS